MSALTFDVERGLGVLAGFQYEDRSRLIPRDKTQEPPSGAWEESELLSSCVNHTVNPERVVRVSKFLSKHLRHQPERIGIVFAPGGWVDVDALLHACAKNGVAISRADLDELVATNDKKRFSFDETGTRIRANQGHTIEVDLELAPGEPPETLFHGTAERSVPAIFASGLLKLARHHVHLSSDVETARKVGARHGRPVVLTVGAQAMHRAGFEFFLSANGVWLVDHVPPEFLRR